jgi:hypothetical protein
MLKTLYSGIKPIKYLPLSIEHLLPASEGLPDFDVTLGIDTSRLPKTQSISFCSLFSHFRGKEDNGRGDSSEDQGLKRGDKKGKALAVV